MGEQGPQAGRGNHDDEVEEGGEEVEEEVYNNDDDNPDEGCDSLVVTIFMISVYDL